MGNSKIENSSLSLWVVIISKANIRPKSNVGLKLVLFWHLFLSNHLQSVAKVLGHLPFEVVVLSELEQVPPTPEQCCQ